MMNLRICITFSNNALTPKRSGLISNLAGAIYQISQSIFPQKMFYLEFYQKQCPLSNLLNYFIVIEKLFLWDCRRSQTLPEIQGLQSKLKIKYEKEKKNINNKTIFEKKWVLTPV